MILDPITLLGEARELATHMVDQIDYVDLYDEQLSQLTEQPVREDKDFTRNITPWLKQRRTRETLKRIIDQACQKLPQQPLALKAMDPEEVCAAAELVTSAIRGLIKAKEPRNAWVLKRRLIIKFTTVEAPWIQDASGPPAIERAAHTVVDATANGEAVPAILT